MPVVINDFEVVPESAPAQAPSANNSAEEDKSSAEKLDIHQMLRRSQERAERVRAH